MKNYYITAGFMGSGSSAITGLLNEFDGLSSPNGEFEYVFLYTPSGLFDLEDKLLVGNNALRSDEAIHSFLSCMYDLYIKKHYWVADYKNKVSPHFFEYAKEMIDELNTIFLNDKDSYWYYMQNPDKFMTFLRMVRKVLYLLSMKKILLNPPLKYKGMMLSYPTKNEFYAAGKKFIYKVMKDIKANNKGVVLDQLLLPHNLNRIDRYFDDDVKVILVERDPRDVFISNKYYWAPAHIASPFSNNVEEFCYQYSRMRNGAGDIEDSRIIKVQFEDLIYDYENTLRRLYSELDLDPVLHTRKRENFNPDISIVNTNLTKKEARFKRESQIIEQNLKEYIYHFPKDKYVNVDGVSVF